MMPVLLHFAGRADYHDAWIRLDAHAEQLLQDLGLGRLDFSLEPGPPPSRSRPFVSCAMPFELDAARPCHIYRTPP
jgi:hypothetical protein